MVVDYEKFIHPFDRAMLKQLKSIPMLDSIVKKVMAALGERIMRGMHEASYTKLSLTQLPEYYKPLLEVCDTLGIEVPDMYLAMNPQPNAYTFGDTKPFIVINHGLIKLLTPEELKAVIAHECGHILCHHVLYNSVARCLLQFGLDFLLQATLIPGLDKLAVITLMYWSRMSEFSCDRAAAYVMGNSDVVVDTMIRLSSGDVEITNKINKKEYMAQSQRYMDMVSKSMTDKILQAFLVYKMDHPFSAVRSFEVDKWFNAEKDNLPEKANAYKMLNW